MSTDLEIARSVDPRPIEAVADDLGVPRSLLVPYGHDKAKIRLPPEGPAALGPAKGRLVLVSAMTPTPAGEGKTTTSVGLAQGIGKLGLKGCVVLREPSLGPCMGMKGGAAGGGRAQVIPMEDLNLHFTGDFHAVTAAHNLLAAMLDNHLHQGNEQDIEPRSVLWKRVQDVNDRALRSILVGLGGRTMGVPRETGFDITAASEVMAILCMSESALDLQERLGRILVGTRRGDRSGVLARDLGAVGAMAVLLKDAVHPNLVQTLEGTPAIVHGGPFANIAQGTNTVMATKTGLAYADWVVTEAGFGFDLGGEKFLHLKCRSAGLEPSCVVVVATVRALKYHGGVKVRDLGASDPGAVERGLPNLARHLESVRGFGLTPVVALNRFVTDSEEELAVVQDFLDRSDVRGALCNAWESGGEGAVELARAVVEVAGAAKPGFTPLYSLSAKPVEKIEAVVKGVYGGRGVEFAAPAKAALRRIAGLGLSSLPVCIAKTPQSLSDDPKRVGRPTDFDITVRDIEIAAGAGFLVPLTGEIMRMPGLGKRPAAVDMGLDSDGRIFGLS